ncbi:MAG: flavin reductase [Chloroflexi bacterium RBG_16_50_9]|nr:MAG: flavin reductase [Chloroflexi bacterium RBG_16_50_9]
MNLSALHKLGYGMYVVCSRKGDKINGQIANTVFQITSEPPTVAVSINKKNLTHDFIKDSHVFTASILCQATPLAFIGAFGFKSGRDVDKFKDVNYKVGVTQSPVVLDNAVAYLEAEVIHDLDVGTHTIFIGRIVAAEVLTDEACMTYEFYHQVKRGTTPKTAPSYIAKEKEGPV